MRVVLDTGAFYRPAKLHEVRSGETTVIVPTIAVAERRRQLARDRHSLDAFMAFLAESAFVIESFGSYEMVNVPFLEDAPWVKHARDAMIAAHVRQGDVLWTTNPRDFLAIGLAPEQIRGI